MRDRIIVLKSLLATDGFIIVHLDDVEVHYCKILLDEIFGRESFISHITYERSGVAGLGQGGFLVNTTEHVLFYRHMTDPSGNNFGKYALDENTIRRYNRFLENLGEKEIVEEFVSKSNKESVKIYKHKNYEVKTISLADFVKREKEIRREFAKNLNKLFRGNRVQQENEFQNSLISKMDKNCLYSVEYTPSRGKYKDEKTNLYYLNNELLSWLGDNSQIEDGEIVKSMKLTTLWDKEDIPKADIANEGGVNFPRGKKPENLIKRVLDLCTVEGDIVLDCFGGSGSTFATAHKMKRRWIGIEIGTHADTHIIPRLKSVISGKDTLGISKKVDWYGGGSFAYFHLGDSIINIDEETGKGEFNWKLGKQFIQDALLLSFDFLISNEINISSLQIFEDLDKFSVGKLIGKGNKTIYGIAYLVSPGEKNLTISNDEIKTIYSALKKLKDFNSLVIYTNKGIDIAQDTIPKDMDIVKVPHAIFSELER
jgi:adenine-specific DNA-methyltransferase